ncbi:hypothetical protein H696_03382 [Fonticula alba]|uniref:BHLH domain-containing protein n=1 Tax=Fonticula alba TaxID=691883 RepID=A0A058Z8R2_FONAL|nr:hypothetical protein H696_03382 [Fonticula alba]KCV69917.1 hypothetical protein H696_03382 [Fonticula alba]|eukprot:XP_009495523.1 hypothetical protein H696_03382 [Fonticula alba]
MVMAHSSTWANFTETDALLMEEHGLDEEHQFIVLSSSSNNLASFFGSYRESEYAPSPTGVDLSFAFVQGSLNAPSGQSPLRAGAGATGTGHDASEHSPSLDLGIQPVGSSMVLPIPTPESWSRAGRPASAGTAASALGAPESLGGDAASSAATSTIIPPGNGAPSADRQPGAADNDAISLGPGSGPSLAHLNFHLTPGTAAGAALVAPSPSLTSLAIGPGAEHHHHLHHSQAPGAGGLSFHSGIVSSSSGALSSFVNQNISLSDMPAASLHSDAAPFPADRATPNTGMLLASGGTGIPAFAHANRAAAASGAAAARGVEPATVDPGLSLHSNTDALEPSASIFFNKDGQLEFGADAGDANIAAGAADLTAASIDEDDEEEASEDTQMQSSPEGAAARSAPRSLPIPPRSVTILSHTPSPVSLSPGSTPPAPVAVDPSVRPRKTRRSRASSPEGGARASSSAAVSVPTAMTDPVPDFDLDLDPASSYKEHGIPGYLAEKRRRNEPLEEDEIRLLEIADPDARRRFAHQNAEQKRRNHIKQAFLDLRLAIPETRDKKTVSKAQILHSATVYIAENEDRERTRARLDCRACRSAVYGKARADVLPPLGRDLLSQMSHSELVDQVLIKETEIAKLREALVALAAKTPHTDSSAGLGAAGSSSTAIPIDPAMLPGDCGVKYCPSNPAAPLRPAMMYAPAVRRPAAPSPVVPPVNMNQLTQMTATGLALHDSACSSEPTSRSTSPVPAPVGGSSLPSPSTSSSPPVAGSAPPPPHQQQPPHLDGGHFHHHEGFAQAHHLTHHSTHVHHAHGHHAQPHPSAHSRHGAYHAPRAQHAPSHRFSPAQQSVHFADYHGDEHQALPPTDGGGGAGTRHYAESADGGVASGTYSSLPASGGSSSTPGQDHFSPGPLADAGGGYAPHDSTATSPAAPLPLERLRHGFASTGRALSDSSIPLGGTPPGGGRGHGTAHR